MIRYLQFIEENVEKLDIFNFGFHISLLFDEQGELAK